VIEVKMRIDDQIDFAGSDTAAAERIDEGIAVLNGINPA